MQLSPHTKKPGKYHLVQLECGQTLDAQVCRQRVELIRCGVKLDKCHIRMLGQELIHKWRNHAAFTTPRGVEIHNQLFCVSHE